jgi:hypothetical protein
MKTAVAVTLLIAASGAAHAALNYDPLTPAPAPVLDQGWSYDQINLADDGTAASVSVDGPYLLQLSDWACFTLTDAFINGDTYRININGTDYWSTDNVAGTPNTIIGDATGEAAWVAPEYDAFQIELPAGAYRIAIWGDGAGGIPAGFYTRLDAGRCIPETSTVLSGGALAGLLAFGVWRRTRKA